MRFLSNVVASCVLAFLFNGPPTHGTFSFGLTTAQLLWIVCGSVVVLMGATLPMMVDHSGGGGELDTSSGESKGARALLRDFSRLMAQPAAWRLACAMTALTSLGLVNNNATNNANAEWFSMSPLQFGISAALNSVVLSVGMWAFKRWLLNVNWRITYAVGALGMQAFGLLYLLTIYYPYFRNGWWIVFTSQDQELAYALTFAIGVVIIPEITLPGYEGLTYGAITTFTNCAQNITSMINNLLLAVWPSNASRDDLKSDTPEVQRHMMYLTIATAAVALSSLAFLPLLPAQKDHIAQLRLRPAAPRAGNLMVAALAAAHALRHDVHDPARPPRHELPDHRRRELVVAALRRQRDRVIKLLLLSPWYMYRGIRASRAAIAPSMRRGFPHAEAVGADACHLGSRGSSGGSAGDGYRRMAVSWRPR